MKLRRLKSAFTVALCVVVIAAALVGASAADFSDGSLTLHYNHDKSPISGADVSIYYVASWNSDGTFSLSDDFAGYPVQINMLRTVAEWDALAETLRHYVAFDGLTPVRSLKSDDAGIVSFEELKAGIYLVLTSQVNSGDKILKFSPALLSVPAKDENGNWVYDVNAFPKSSEYTPEDKELSYRVQKLWVGDSNDVRPDKIAVTIIRNGEVEYRETLSEQNNWSFSWSAPDDGSVWGVVEDYVPEHYTAVVESNGNTFIVTNTYDGEVNPPMGDSRNIVPTVLIMAVSGLCLILIGLGGKRSKEA